ncbi:MAG: ABC transporter permease [Desulfobacterales bacterium]|nr:ABC transporter permease [Desulfobacterales bacterium]
MNIKRFWAMFKARNREFFRDRAAFGWNFLFPFLLVAGFGIIFNGKVYNAYKVGVFPVEKTVVAATATTLPDRFQTLEQLEFIGFESLDDGLDKLRHHKVDFLVELGPRPYRYWVNDSSPKGYILQKLFEGSLATPAPSDIVQKIRIESLEIRYIDWLFPGILGMNMMFSALWGVGYVVVRYRKNGVLKRLKATPLTALEYLSAQMLSRLFLLMFTLVVVWTGCHLIFSFTMIGSYVLLALVFFLGSLSLTSLGLILASRGTSEELTTGILNFISWPMMFLSEVWFSIEGAPQWVQLFSRLFPLTHLLTAARKIMSDGAGLVAILPEITTLSVMSVVFLAIGALLFSWTK